MKNSRPQTESRGAEVASASPASPAFVDGVDRETSTPVLMCLMRPYARPELKRLGSVRDLTLGQSGGRFADGGSKNRKTPA